MRAGTRQASSVVLLIAAACTMLSSLAAAADLRAHVTGGVTTYTVARGDTLGRIGAQFGVHPSTLATENHVDVGRLLAIGQQLRIDNRHVVPALVEPHVIIVNVPQRMLFYEDAAGLSAYPIAVGRTGWQTPPASFTVVRKEQDPTWHVPASILAESTRAGRKQPLVVPPGPNNPLGRFWIGLSLPGLGIHGTPFESSIYQTATHGCIRLRRDDIADLFARVDIGTSGRIIYEPILLAEGGDDVYIEVHADVYRRLRAASREVARELAARSGLADRIDWTVADAAIDAHEGIARRVTIASDESD